MLDPEGKIAVLLVVALALLCMIGASCGPLATLLGQAKVDLRLHQECGQLAIRPFLAITELQEDYKQSALSEPSEANIERHVTYTTTWCAGHPTSLASPTSWDSPAQQPTGISRYELDASSFEDLTALV